MAAIKVIYRPQERAGYTGRDLYVCKPTENQKKWLPSEQSIAILAQTLETDGMNLEYAYFDTDKVILTITENCGSNSEIYNQKLEERFKDSVNLKMRVMRGAEVKSLYGHLSQIIKYKC